MLLAAACGPPPLKTFPTPSTSPVPTRTVTVLPTKAEVVADLLTPAEIPGGGTFTVSPIQGANPAADLGNGIEGCGGNETPGDASVSALAVAQVSLTGPYVAENITVTSYQEAEHKMAALADVVKNCDHFSASAGGGLTADVTIGPLTVAPVGDQVVAFRLTASIQGAGVGLYAHVVTVRTGNVLVLVTHMTLTSPDVQITESIVQAAVNKALPLRGAP